jgi:transposase
MRLYIGVDFHPHQQTVCWVDIESGELRNEELLHEVEEVRKFYRKLPPSLVGVEASARAMWFEDLLFECGHELVVGDPVLIRKRAVSRHKSDRRDAEHIRTLLVNGEFPTLWRRPRASVNILEIVSLRSSLVRQRTQSYNRLQRIAHECGFRRGRMGTVRFRGMLREAALGEAQQLRREHLFRLTEALDKQIEELDEWLKVRAEENEQVRLLLTQPGVGYLTALALVHTIDEVQRFNTTRQITAYLGLDPLERSSGSRTRIGRISKAGSPLLRHLLGQAAHIAVRYDKRLKSFYQRLAKKKPKSVAKTATARKLAVKLSIMLRDRITAQEFEARGKRTVDDARLALRPEMAVP